MNKHRAQHIQTGQVMSGEFDAYYKWLGIPPREQPPHNYRLLGLELFETDPDVIDAAAERNMSFLQEICDGPQLPAAQRLLNEISAARLCLLSRERKADYDRQLRRELAERNRPPAKKGCGDAGRSQLVVRPDPPRSIRPRSRTTRNSRLRAWSISGGIAAALLVALALFDLRRGPRTGSDPQPADPYASAGSPRRGGAGPSPAEPHIGAAVAEQDGHMAAPRADPGADQPPRSSTEFAEADTGGRTQVAVPSSLVQLAEHERSLPDQPFGPGEEAPADADQQTSRPPPALTGQILREIWRGCKGNQVADLLRHIQTCPDPDQVETITALAAPEDFDDQYGQRIRGYLHPPLSGRYLFTIRANAEGLLWLSTDASPDNRLPVADGRQVELQAGQVYYVEGLHKESTGRDHFAVGWRLPDGTLENPIPGERLSVEPRIYAPHEKGFTVLVPIQADASGGSELTILADGVILAQGQAPAGGTYEVHFETDIPRITALRLEALPHDSLPGGGPGWGLAGRFSISEIEISVRRPGQAGGHQLTISDVFADDARKAARMIDGSLTTYWSVHRRGQPAEVTLLPSQALHATAGTVLILKVINRDRLGCFRLLATSADW